MARAVGGRRGERVPAAEQPVARVVVDVPLPHLDRPFDYRVPADLSAEARPGVRVRVRFSGRLVDGWVLERTDSSAHTGTLAWVEKVVSAEPVLAPEIATLCRTVADRYGGVLADVLRLAIPPRRAAVEAEKRVPSDDGRTPSGSAAPSGSDAPPEVGSAGIPVVPRVGAPVVTPGQGWGRYPRGAAFLSALGAGRAAHAVWQALPGERWPERVAEAVAATAATGRGALVVLPDQRDVDAAHAACVALLGEDAVVALTAELGPTVRYRRWLAVRRGQVRVVVGTRAAMFAPVHEPGLLVVWDDGDDLHSEPRAPYPHVRDVLVLRAHAAGAALLVAGRARTAEAQVLVESGWANSIAAERHVVRDAMPRVTAIGEHDEQLARDAAARTARIPHDAFEAARAALAAGRPVLVQVPRAGYVPSLMCGSCREPARCRHCAGPLSLPRPPAPSGPTSSSDAPVRSRAREALARAGGGVSAPVGAGRSAAVGPPASVSSSQDSLFPGPGDGGGGHEGRRFSGPADGRGAPVGPRVAGFERSGGSGAAGARAGGGRADGGRADGARADVSLPHCRWCGRAEPAFRCGACGSRRLRAGMVGAGRTAEELGRAFPGVPVRGSGGGSPVLVAVDARPELVVATPGAEPVAEGGYGAALLLDAWSLLSRPDLRVAEEALRRWFAAAAMVVPHGVGGRVVITAEAALPVVQALVRWDPVGHAETELASRAEVGFPPAVRMAAVEGLPGAVAEVVDQVEAELEGVEVLGPVEIEPAPGDEPGAERERMLLRVPRARGRALAAALHDAQSTRSARKATEPVRVRLDPADMA